MIAKSCFVVLAALTVVAPVNGATYYIAPSYGDDSYPGNQAQPFATIGRAASVVVPGDTVSIGGGNYSEDVEINVPGSAAAPVLFQGAADTVLLGNLSIDGSYVTVDGLTISPPGGYSAVEIGGSYNTLRNSVITNYGATPSDQAAAISIDGAFNTVDRCSILNLDDIDGFHVFGHDQTISGNTVVALNQVHYDLNHTDFIQSWSFGPDQFAYNILVVGNVVRDSTCQLGNLESDGNPNMHDWTFANNIFVRVGNDLCAGIPGTAFFNNLFYHARVSLYTNYNYSSLGDRFANNIFINDDDQRGVEFRTAAPEQLALFTHNYFARPDYTPVGISQYEGSDSIDGGDPKFADVTNLDFHPGPGSALAGTGLFIATLTVDADGGARSANVPAIGPYQAF